MCSVVGMVDTCLEQDLATFKASCQDMVDELEELRRRCSEPVHRARITRLLFIITRCSRLVFTGLPRCSMVQAAICANAGRATRLVSGLPVRLVAHFKTRQLAKSSVTDVCCTTCIVDCGSGRHGK